MERMLLKILFNQWLNLISTDRIDLLEKEIAQAIEALNEERRK